MKPTAAKLRFLYLKKKISPEKIGEMYGAHGRTVRDWMESYGIPRLGPTHLITGRPAPWNKKPKPPHVIEAMRQANIGKIPHNKGKGNITFQCEVCATTVSDKPYRRRRTCSKDCKNKLMSLLRGERHWNYRGAADTQRKRLYAEALEWRRGVIDRDKRCLACGSKKKLRAHHLDGWSKHPEKRFELTNGATLCHDCHWQFHRATSHKNATKAMFDSWIRTSKG